jgi:hypothetical protein
MDARLNWNVEHGAGTSDSEEAWLLGQPTLESYLDYLKDTAIANGPRSSWVDEWRAANEYYFDLADKEASLPDQIEIRDLDPGLQPLIDEVVADSRFQRAFDALPTQFAMVELDKLIVPQRHVDLHQVARLKTRLGDSATPEALFRFCLPITGCDAPVQMRRVGSRRFLFWSRSSDFRFHEATLLEPDQIRGYDPYGSLGPVVGLMVGYGSNFLNAIRSDDRLLLHNGHHRAYAMREMGITHAPCLIRTVTCRDELSLVASADTANNPGFFFKAPRPPLLKDFFDAKIRKVLRVPQLMRMIEVSFEVKEHEVRDFQLAG